MDVHFSTGCLLLLLLSLPLWLLLTELLSELLLLPLLLLLLLLLLILLASLLVLLLYITRLHLRLFLRFRWAYSHTPTSSLLTLSSFKVVAWQVCLLCSSRNCLISLSSVRRLIFSFNNVSFAFNSFTDSFLRFQIWPRSVFNSDINFSFLLFVIAACCCSLPDFDAVTQLFFLILEFPHFFDRC